MLKDNLFTIADLNQENGIYKAKVVIEPAHEIFKGHFPEQPILPGVCLLEMVKELLKEIEQQPCKLVNAANIKYLKVVDPRTDNTLKFEMGLTNEEGFIKVNVTSFLQDGTANFKFKGTFA